MPLAEIETVLVAGDADAPRNLVAGGATHPVEYWVIYHGAVTQDSDGPMEVCVPYSRPSAPARNVLLRVEPTFRRCPPSPGT